MRRAVAVCSALLMLAAWLQTIGAQQPTGGAHPLGSLRASNITTGSPTEHTLLLLNLLSDSPVATTIRPFSLSQRQLLRRAMAVAGDTGGTAAGLIEWAAPAVSGWVNSSRATHDRDGAVWQGRGLTASATGGLVLERPFVSIAVRPLVFGSQNLSYVPLSGGAIPPGDFRNPFPFTGPFIDLPYRFGDRAIGAVDPGESWIRVGIPFLSGGFSTASQHWGPAAIYPLLMGVEGGGYPRVFIESSSVPVGIGRASLHWSVGRLESSGFAGLAGGERSRIVPAVVGSFVPAGLPGVEVGGARQFHQRWSGESASLETAAEPFRAVFKKRTRANAPTTNQIASVFARVAPPGAGIEVYGELYREDHNADVRDLIGEPDHASAYMLGLRRAWLTGAGAIRAVTLETANSRISHLQRIRAQAPLYIHSALTEGHTNRGQPLGSYAVFGGGGMTALVEQIGERRSYSAEAALRRSVQQFEGGLWDGRLSGFYGLTLRRTDHGRVGTHGWMVGLDLGFGRERGANLTVQRTFQWAR